MKRFFKPIPKAVDPQIISPVTIAVAGEPQACEECDATPHKKRGRIDCEEGQGTVKRVKSDEVAEATQYLESVSVLPACLDPAVSSNAQEPGPQELKTTTLVRLDSQKFQKLNTLLDQTSLYSKFLGDKLPSAGAPTTAKNLSSLLSGTLRPYQLQG